MICGSPTSARTAGRKSRFCSAPTAGAAATTSGGDCERGVDLAGDRPENNIDPVFVYPHGDGVPSGCSITGGEVYRGSAIPDLFGAYVFGDYCTSRIWAISVRSGEVVFRDLDAFLPGGELVDFARDPNGELVALSLGGQVVRILPRSAWDASPGAHQ